MAVLVHQPLVVQEQIYWRLATQQLPVLRLFRLAQLLREMAHQPMVTSDITLLLIRLRAMSMELGVVSVAHKLVELSLRTR